MNELRLGKFFGWVILAAVGGIAAVYFIDPTRWAALTQTAGWFLTAARSLLP